MTVPLNPLSLMTQVYREVMPAVHEELKFWKKRAEEIPNQELKGQALASITHKTFHCEGGSIMAFYLINATFQFLFYPPVAAVAFSALFLCIPFRLFAERKFQLRELSVLSLLLFSPILIAFVTEFEAMGRNLPDTNALTDLILLILGLQLVWSAILVWKLQGVRMACLAFCVFALCPSLGAALEATMCVTDRWL